MSTSKYYTIFIRINGSGTITTVVNNRNHSLKNIFLQEPSSNFIVVLILFLQNSVLELTFKTKLLKLLQSPTVKIMR